jgi:hypothetical protein
MPTRFIHSRSAVIPSRVTLPFIQCHQTRGLASSGGVRKERSSDGRAAAAVSGRDVVARDGVARCAWALLVATASVVTQISEDRIDIMRVSAEERGASSPRAIILAPGPTPRRGRI